MERLSVLGSKVQAFRALRHRDFRWFWLGSNAQAAGRGMQFFLLAWMVLELINSASRMGFMILLYGSTGGALILFAGIFADRFDRLRLAISTQVSVVVVVLVLATVQATEQVALWHLYLTAFLLGAFQAINTPARLAIVADLVDREDIMNAVALNSAVMNAGRIVGPVVAGVIVELAGIAPALYVAVGFFATGAVTLLMVKPAPRTARHETSPILSDLVTGFRYCWSNPVTFTVIGIGFAFGFFGMPYQQVLPAFAKQVLAADASEAGVLMTGAGIGTLSGTVLLASLGNIGYKNRVFLICMSLFGISLFLLGWSPLFGLSWVVLFFIGLGDIVPMGTTVLQLSVPSELQGRVMSIWYVSAAFMFIGSYPMTLVADNLGWTVAFSGGAAIYLAIAFILGIVRPTLRRLEV